MTDASGVSLSKPLTISLVIIVAMAGLSVYGWLMLPADARLPIHWGIDGKPDGYAGKAFALSMMPFLAVLITVLMAVMPRIDPRRVNLLQSSKAYRFIWVTLIGFLALIHASLVAQAIGLRFEITTAIGIGMGILFMVIGNFLSKVRSNFSLGIRTRWTLSSDRVWDKTHRAAGPAFFLLGLIMFLTSLFAPTPTNLALLIVGILLVAGFSVIYSYILWSQEQRGSTGGNVGSR